MVFSTIAPLFRGGYFLNLPRYTAAGLITGYQRYLSPIKGFSCAHRVLHCGESCSQYVKRTILERGLSDAWPESRQRFRDCRSAYLTIMASRSEQDDGEPTNGKRSNNDSPNAPSCIPDIGDAACCLADAIDFWACDAGACDVGALDCGGCDVGSC